MAWTPENLTSTEFVRTQLSPLDRSNALLTMTQNLTRVQSRLAENKAALDQVQDQTNGPYSFGTVRDARNAAQAAAAQGLPNAAALQVQYEELLAKRQDLNAQADTLLRAVQSGEDAVRTSTIAISNLEAAGAVPPGTNQFTPPPGYNSTMNPPAEVPASQNPASTATTTSENVQNPIPISVNPNSDPNTNIGAEAQDFVSEPLQEPPSTQDEFDGIDAQVAANENSLQEPPQLSDEEVDNYFDQLRQEQEQIENRDPATIEENVFNPGTTFNAGEESVFDPTAGGTYSPQGLSTSLNKTRSTATRQDVSNFKQKEDWRVRLSLAPSADYLYKADSKEERGILDPLATTDGVIFPYTPGISVQYAAHYDQTELTHSNYKYFQYKSSSVDQISITCDFTAQDTEEARYLLAVIHFFRSVTKMFYGQDNGPKPGTPPPLCYLTGLGAFQFDAHPLAITAFTYNLPTDVDYIRAGSVSALAGVNQSRSNNPVNSSSASNARRGQSGLNEGATRNGPNWSNSGSTTSPTYVPTKMQMQITAVPIVTRYDISQKFSLAEYGTGKLLQGTQRSGGGIW